MTEAYNPHFPFWHVCPDEHGLLHLPQCWLLVWVLMHDPPQLFWPALQLIVQEPAEQTLPDAHFILQAPQWVVSDWRSAQVP
jgi:hypothetical protein